jgi:RHH-type proline utilization regulon transcriptional repressor/proline dehydrogenase/delta 1-pyrroline-5-carboxylate dehydrogenase
MDSDPHGFISEQAFTGEAQLVRGLLAQVDAVRQLEPAIMARASAWLGVMRGKSHGIETFLNAYGFDTEEGIALMCLAEALLRIPDPATADALIHGIFDNRHWDAGGDSWLVGLSNWGLLLTGKVTAFGRENNPLKRLIGRMGEPVIREALKRAMALIGQQFVLGQNVAEALKHSRAYPGYRFSYDILGEGARSDAQALGYVASYRAGIALIGQSVAPGTPLFEAPGISVKLSALHPRYALTQHKRVMAELLPRLRDIALHAREAGLTLAIDAEESSRLDGELLVFGALLADPQLAGWNGLGFVVQAYQKRALPVIDWLADKARAQGRIIPLRLVKGAYWDSEIKWAQIQGLPDYPVFTRKEHTDLSYLACADRMLRQPGVFYPQFATHNARSAASVMALAEHYGWEKRSYEFQRLHGMGEALHDAILAEAPSRIYAPVGAHKDLLAYLIRRLLENGANSSFVHALMDSGKGAGDILADPLAVAARAEPAIAPPRELYGAARMNSCGMDFGNLAQLRVLQAAVAPWGSLPPPPPEADVEKIITTARAALPSWAAMPVDARAGILERMADSLEANRAELVALCAREAGKTLPDGIAEIREAADFCRYYAAQARCVLAAQPLDGPAGERNTLSLHPRGLFACISPWNFPLAIFTGQVAAALVAGNGVIAKPAEQTPRIARRAVELFHAAGVPRDILQLAVGSGETVGAALVADRRIDGVAFTGGTDTALHIQRALAARGGALVPLIAETGGQNAMIVDSSALPEQAVDDIMASAFGSAGQRCSALRVLYVQDDIADALCALLAGAMQALVAGDPLDPATDTGPVIDRQAQQALLAHIADAHRTPDRCRPGCVHPRPFRRVARLGNPRYRCADRRAFRPHPACHPLQSRRAGAGHRRHQRHRLRADLRHP